MLMNSLLSNKTFITLILVATALLTVRTMTKSGGCPACLLLPKEMTRPKPSTTSNTQP